MSRDVHINGMQRPSPVLNARYEMERKVGGFIYGGETVSRSTIIIDKNVFTVGEFINVRIQCNNQDCSKPVAAFSV